MHGRILYILMPPDDFARQIEASSSLVTEMHDQPLTGDNHRRTGM